MPPSNTPKRVSFYWLSGDEPLLLQEARDQLCQRAAAAGFVERHILTMESSKDWQQLPSMTHNMGLFNQRQLIDIRVPGTKFEKSTQQVLHDTITTLNPDCFILLSCGKLTGAQKKAKWFKNLEPYIHVQFFWPLSARELPNWIQNRLKTHQLTAERDAIRLLIDLTEGNLLATHQAIQKLALRYPNQALTATQVGDVLHDSAQFNVFDLVNYALAGNASRALHAIETLQASGGEPILVLWALAREIRELYHNIYQYERGTPLNTLLAKQWSNRKPLVQRAMQRLSLPILNRLLKEAHRTDLMIKGCMPGNAWQQLKTITATLTGALA